MSGFAELLHDAGFTVKGSDANRSKITEHLQSLGVEVLYGQKSNNITSDIDFVVYTAAIHPDNPEFRAAKEMGLPMMERAEMVGQVMKNYTNAIGVSGTHGKTTTTSMLTHIFLAAKKDPTISVGGILDAIHGNIRVGHSENFITEACEYTNSFLKFHPTAGIILNIDADHLDFFKDLDDIRHSFHRFAKLLPKDGVLIINSDIEKLDAITNDLDCRIITFGLENPADYEAKDITFGEDGCGSFELVRFGKETGIRVRLSVIGRHNVANALSAIATAEYYDIPMETTKRDSSPSTARNVVSNKKDRSTESPWSMIMHIILRRSKQRCRLLPSSHISVFGAYSNHIHTAAPEHCCTNLQRRFPSQIMLCLQTYMPPERLIPVIFLLKLYRKK